MRETINPEYLLNAPSPDCEGVPHNGNLPIPKVTQCDASR
jgi:hypothetical protein